VTGEAPVTLAVVARVSGVSPATASRALNGRSGVDPEVAARVTAVARSLGYRPNAAARLLASGRSGVIGLVMSSNQLVCGEYGPHIVRALTEACTVRGLGVMLWLLKPEPDGIVRDVRAGRLVDGFVVTGVGFGTPWVEELIDGPQPCVLIGRHRNRPGAAVVEPDNYGGAFAAVDHLVSTGRHRIATITGPVSSSDSRDRFRGYCNALEAHGLPIDPVLIERGDFRSPSAESLTSHLLAHRPDAIFAANDLMAIGVHRAVVAAGLRVPDDIAIAGFDDLPDANRSISTPLLTSVRQDLEAMATSALEVLDAMLSGGGPQHRVVPTHLVVRKSTGTPVAVP
jgi:LacI family transcriptional regulator